MNLNLNKINTINLEMKINNESNQIDTNQIESLFRPLSSSPIYIWYFTVQYVCLSIRLFVCLFWFSVICAVAGGRTYKEDSIYLCLFPYLSVCMGRISEQIDKIFFRLRFRSWPHFFVEHHLFSCKRSKLNKSLYYSISSHARTELNSQIIACHVLNACKISKLTKKSITHELSRLNQYVIISPISVFVCCRHQRQKKNL